MITIHPFRSLVTIAFCLRKVAIIHRLTHKGVLLFDCLYLTVRYWKDRFALCHSFPKLPLAVAPSVHSVPS